MIFNALIFFRVNARFCSLLMFCESTFIRKLTAALVQLSFTVQVQKNKYRKDDSYIHYYLIIYLTKTTPQDNTLGIVFYNIFL